MSSSVRRLLAVAGATVMLTGALASTAHAEAASCQATELALPVGADPALSQVLTADETGKYLLGSATKPGFMWEQPVVWQAGEEPKWIEPLSGWVTSAVAVSAAGQVAGMSDNGSGRPVYWLYSIAEKTYRELSLPAGVHNVRLMDMNENHDVVGYGWNAAGELAVPFVIPFGKPAQLLPTLYHAEAVAITDSGRVVGHFKDPEGFDYAAYWDSWNGAAKRLPSAKGDQVVPRAVAGPWIAGEEVHDHDVTTGLIWTDDSAVTAQLERGIQSINTARDVVTQAGQNVDSKLIKADGSTVEFPAGTSLNHVADRGAPFTVAGRTSNGSFETKATVWTCG